MKYILLNEATKQVVMEKTVEDILKTNIFNFKEKAFLDAWEVMVKNTHGHLGNTLYKIV